MLNWRGNALRVVVMACAIALISFGCSQEGVDSNFVVGGVLPLTGDAGTFGQNANRGIKLAIETARDSGYLDQPVSYLSENSEGRASLAVSAARKLLDVSGAEVLIGDVTSAGTQALIPIIDERQVPLVSPAASDPGLTGASPYFARTWPSDVYEARVIGSYISSQDHEDLGIVYANTDYGVAMVEELRSSLSSDLIGPRIGIDRGTSDYRPTIQRLSNAGVDAVFLVMYPEGGRRFLNQMAELGLEKPIYATATFQSPEIAEAPGAGRIVFASPSPPSGSKREWFEEAYREKYDEAPGVLSDTGFDSAMLLIKGWAARGHQGPQAVVSWIRAREGYNGVSGELTFTEGGNVRKPYGLKTIENGEFVWQDRTVETAAPGGE